MESIICLPVLLLLSLGVAQFAHIWYCRTIVRYAAFCGGRAVLTAPAGRETAAAREAAEIVCAPIAFMNPSSEPDFALPGISAFYTDDGQEVNSISASGAVRSSAGVLVVRVSDPDAWRKCVEVEMKVPLLVPFAGPVIGKLMSVWNSSVEFDINDETPDGTVIQKFAADRTSRICLRERAYIAKPFLSTWSVF